ncbi:hypothetical protein CRM22_001542 [Opisthorchis felineus]|uniref:dual-specificity kinase n=1 Tax=Opisthorchis felineus TaxID=147828 RepID=A0A4S2MA59_OPIFE|nr:hypothetical protein CRM22_001542 [Opisthorchis felineus]
MDTLRRCFWFVHHRPSNQLMAMKLTKEASVQRREIELLSSVDHKNVLRLFGSCVIGARFACLTEFVNGGSLADLLSAKGMDLPWLLRSSLALDIANGLHHLHCNNLIHRDLSSANILIRVGPFVPSEPDDVDSKNFPGHLVYGVSGGQNVVVSDTAFVRDCPAHSRSRRPCSKVQLNYSQRQAEFSTNGRSLSPVCMAVDREQMGGDISSCSTECDGPITMQNGDPSMLEQTKFAKHCLLSLPIIEPVWKRLAWSSALFPPDTSPSYTAVVADLGLCLDLSQTNTDAVSLVGNPYYIAPECLNRIAPYTFAADVFSFGILTCELITRLVNDGARIPRTNDFGLDHQNLPVPPTCPPRLHQVALDCCTVDHLQRPPLKTIITELVENLTDHHPAGCHSLRTTSPKHHSSRASDCVETAAPAPAVPGLIVQE